MMNHPTATVADDGTAPSNARRNLGHGQHPMSGIADRKRKGEEITDEKLRSECLDHIKMLSASCCIEITSGRKTPCSCMKVLSTDSDAAGRLAEFVKTYGFMNRSMKQTLFKEWMRHGETLKHAILEKAPHHKKKFPTYSLPMNAPSQRPNAVAKPILFCLNALCKIVGIGRTALRTIRRSYQTDPFGPVATKYAGNKNRQKGSKSLAALPELRVFFEELIELAEPYATKFVREETRCEVREDDPDIVELPPSTTKRGLHRRFLFEQGYELKTDAKGRHPKLGNYTVRKDKAWIESKKSPGKKIVWSTFCQVWRREYPKLRIRAPSRDTCDDCVKLRNLFRRRKRASKAPTTPPPGAGYFCEPCEETSQSRKRKHEDSFDSAEGQGDEPKANSDNSVLMEDDNQGDDSSMGATEEIELVRIRGGGEGVGGGIDDEASDSESDDGDLDEMVVNDNLEDIELLDFDLLGDGEFVMPNLDEIDPSDDEDEDEESLEQLDEYEKEIAKANLHIKHAKFQRELMRQKIIQAREDRRKGVPRSNRVFTFILDYAQNLGLPHYGAEQPGATYYFSPLGVYEFGIVDASGERDHLHAYVYPEGTGNKGGNNVASMLMAELRRQGLLDKSEGPSGELNLVMDNCRGQNKNRMVLRLAVFLVECGFFKRVNIIFLVRGHTKNACDRLFNLMKLRFHKEDCYTFSQLKTLLSKQDDVTIYDASKGIFFNYDEMLNKFYKKLQTGSVAKNHIFSASAEDPGVMHLQVARGEEETSQDLVLGPRGEDRVKAMEGTALSPLVPPGIKPIKQVEMHTKYRFFVPEEFWPEICPEPDQEVVNKVKVEKKEKRSKKNKGKAKVGEPKKEIICGACGEIGHRRNNKSKCKQHDEYKG